MTAFTESIVEQASLAWLESMSCTIQVAPVIKETATETIVITVHTFFF